MVTTTIRPLRALDYVPLNIYWFAISFMWNSLGPILLPTLVTQLVPETQKGGAVGLLASLGAIVAIIVQPLAGAWSDHHTTRWGKRRPYIVGGTLGDVIFLAGLAFAPSYAWLLVAYVLLQTSSNLAHGPYQGFIPDLVPREKRGAATGVKQFLEIIGIIVTSLATGYLVGQGQIVTAFVAIILVLVTTMGLTALFVDEVPFTDAQMPGRQVGRVHPAETSHKIEEAAPVLDSMNEGFSLAVMMRRLFHSRDFGLWLVSRLFILVGAALVRNYALFFLKDVLQLPNPASAVGNLLAVIAIAIALVSYPAGHLSDRWGRKRLTILSGLLGMMGALLLLTATTVTHVLIYGGIIGLGIGIFLSASWAWATDLIPPERSGRYLGISNLATAGSSVLAGLGGVMLDYFNAQSANLGYTVLYLTAAVCYALGTVLAFGVRDVHRHRMR